MLKESNEQSVVDKIIPEGWKQLPGNSINSLVQLLQWPPGSDCRLGVSTPVIVRAGPIHISYPLFTLHWTGPISVSSLSHLTIPKEESFCIKRITNLPQNFQGLQAKHIFLIVFKYLLFACTK